MNNIEKTKLIISLTAVKVDLQKIKSFNNIGEEKKELINVKIGEVEKTLKELNK